MNIFVVDRDPWKAAQSLFNTHVVKMVLETAQILSTISGGPYKPTHVNHPCVIWAKETTGNYHWLVTHGIALGEEYFYRYEKRHKSVDVIRQLEVPPEFVRVAPMTPFVLVMPKEFQTENPIDSYRNYYREKANILFGYTKREPPPWL